MGWVACIEVDELWSTGLPPISASEVWMEHSHTDWFGDWLWHFHAVAAELSSYDRDSKVYKA